MRRQDMRMMEKNVAQKRPAIVVCHSFPSNWATEDPGAWTGQCPPDPKQHPYVYQIGRTMFETDRLPAFFVDKCNAMNEVRRPFIRHLS